MLLPLTTVPVPGPGAEDVLVAPDGRVWTGTAEGAIHVHDPRDGSTTTVTATGGRPLGPWFSDSSRIWPIEEWKNDLIEHTCTPSAPAANP